MTTAMLPVALPRFAPSAPKSSSQTADSNKVSAWVSDVGDPLDFDLLAEYLLDDVGGDDGSFDFGAESAPPSGVVSPEQTEEGVFSDQLLKQTQTKLASAPAQPTLAPAPPIAAPPILGHPGMPIAPAATTFPTLPTPVAGGPLAAAPQVVLHNHAAVPSTLAAQARLAAAAAAAVPPSGNNKRRRVDGAPTAPVPLMAGQLIAPPVVPPPTGRGRQKSQVQIDRRRERNRILARRTRLRKKFFFESLQKEVTDLQRENMALKDIAKRKLPGNVSKVLLDECKALESLPPEVQEACGEGLASSTQDFSLVKSIQQSQQCFVITDPSLQDNPIVYASDDFFTLTGYKREQVLGRNCRFLQGTETSQAKVAQVRKAVTNGEDATVTMINYTANGTAFWNKLFIAALRDANNNIVNFIGVIVKVQSPSPGDPEANKRLPGETKEEETAAASGGDDDDDNKEE